jgi:transposase-like protein
MSKVKMKCPVCGSIEEADAYWLIGQEKLCCRNCTKSYRLEEFKQVFGDDNEETDDSVF